MSNPKSVKPSRYEESDAFETWLTRTCLSGDAESVQQQWEASTDYEDFWQADNALKPQPQKENVYQYFFNKSYGPPRESLPPFDAQYLGILASLGFHLGNLRR